MPPTRQFDPSAAPSASGAMTSRLDRLIGDPLRQELRDPAFMDFVGRQFDRAFPGPVRRDATGRQIDSPPEVEDLERFLPAVARSDLELSGGVGRRQRNRLTDLVGIKKALAKTGFLEFDVTEEPSDKAGPLFQAALGRFQREHGLKVDAVVEPKGPTVKALRKAVFEEGDERESREEEAVDAPERQRARGGNDNAARPQLAQANSAAAPDVVWPQSSITNDFRWKMSKEESTHNYSAINIVKGIPALGRYQMRPGILQDIGMKDSAGNWTGKHGINSRKGFLNDAVVQEKVLQEAMATYRLQLQRKGALDKIGTEIDGLKRKITITEAGLMAAAHRQGAEKVRQYLQHQEANGWKSDFSNVADSKDGPKFAAIEKRLRIFDSTTFAK